jgi:hypothetical protein
MQTNYWIKILFSVFLLPVIIFADDLYLKNGLLYRNVLVVDTTGTILNIIRDSVKTGIRLELIEKIDKREFIPHQKSTRELYSPSKAEEFGQMQLKKLIPQENNQKKNVEDTTGNFNDTVTVTAAIGGYSVIGDKTTDSHSAIDVGIMARYPIYHPIVIRIRLGNNPVHSKILFDPQIGVSWRYFECILGFVDIDKAKKQSLNVRIGSVTGIMFEYGRYPSLPLISGGGFEYSAGIGYYDADSGISWWIGLGDLVQAGSIQVKAKYALTAEYRGIIIGGVGLGGFSEILPVPTKFLGCSISFGVEREISFK